MSIRLIQKTAALLLVAVTATSVPAGTEGPERPQAGPARSEEAVPEPNDLGLPPAHPSPAATQGEAELRPLFAPDGALLGTLTDGASEASLPPLNSIEEAKLAQARSAIARAEAAGTRMVLPVEPVDPGFSLARADELSRAKLERWTAQTPRPLRGRPGTRTAGSEPPASSESEVTR